MPIDRADITGLILAGGRGSRMGGVDKGLQNFHGIPLAQHALRRLAPQVGHLMLNANRNLDAYRAMGAPVWGDEVPDFPGPLAGMLAGLRHCETPYLVTAPCDTPYFPDDLTARLARELLEIGGDIATAYTLEGAPSTWPSLPPIGKAIDGAAVHLLDDAMRPVKPGDEGEWNRREEQVT